MNYLAGLALNCDPPDLNFQVARIAGISYECLANSYF
jgi:hypothetical protein